MIQLRFSESTRFSAMNPDHPSPMNSTPLSRSTARSANAPHPRWCAVDAAPNTTVKGLFADVDTVLDAAIKLKFAMDTQKATGQPWFLGVGLRKVGAYWKARKTVCID